MLKLDVQAQSFPIAGAFTISRGSKTSADVIWVGLSDGAQSGQGEGVPYSRYGETVAESLAALENARAEIEREDNFSLLGLPKAAHNALDCAMWDLRCKRLGKSAWQMANIAPPVERLTAYTLSLDTAENMARAATHAPYPLLKLKLGREGDAARLEAIRKAAPTARLIVDANEGWTPDTLPSLLACCKAQGVELVEQPLPASNDDALRHIKRDVVICADESAHGESSLAALQGKYDAVNIKLDKTGGLTEALAMAKAARAMNFKIFAGCMLATSLAMAPAFILAQLADYVDLDGPLLLAKDRSPAISYINAMMQPPPAALWG